MGDLSRSLYQPRSEVLVALIAGFRCDSPVRPKLNLRIMALGHFFLKRWPAAATCLPLLCFVAALSAPSPAKAAATTFSTPTATGHGYITGIGDESPQMLGNPFWLRLHTKIVR